MNQFFKILIIFTFFILVACNNGPVVLVNGVNQDIANSIVLQLGQSDINANKTLQKDGSYSISVAKNKEFEALSILSRNGQPNKTYVSLGEVFKKDSFISSPMEEHARLLYALDQEISGMLSILNGVVEVKTRISIPTPSDNLYQSETIKPSAAVIIKYKQGERIDLYLTRIKNLVSDAVPGLTPDRVEILTIIQK